ncbi:MAG: ABC transporter permease subunit, partial [Thermoplasmata archaeon]
PVSGVVVNSTQGPVAGAVVVVGPAFTTTEPNGSFELNVSNGTWAIAITASGYANLVQPLDVHGPLSGLDFVLRAQELFVLGGEVQNALSRAPISNVPVAVATAAGPLEVLVTGSEGLFSTMVPNGTYNLTIAPTSEYAGSSVIVRVSGRALTRLEFPLFPVASSFPGLDPSRLVVVLPLGAVVVGSAGVYLHEFRRRRLAMGLPGRILSPFGRYVVMRALLVPAQASLLIGLVYVFDYIIASPSSVNLVQAFTGFGVVWYDLFTGNWGVSSFFGVTASTSSFFVWWLPPSLELAAAALGLSALISYPLGLVAGGGRSPTLDGSVRVASAVALMVPTFLVGLTLIFLFNPLFTSAFGDGPFGLLPSPAWFALNTNGFPSWVGPAGNTSPTDLPILDPAIHGAWGVEAIAWAKLGLQALVIAIVFSAIFLRYARGAIVEAAREMYLTGARSRGVSESTLLWHHLARRALPYYFLAFGLSLPAYIGTQALVEYLFEDRALGTLILSGLTGPSNVFTGVGVFQVAIFLVIIAVLFSVLFADVVARYLDPRLLRRER